MIISIKCKNKNCPLPNTKFLELKNSRNQLCSFCRWELEKKLAKIQKRNPIMRNIGE